MIARRELSREQAEHAMGSGEFDTTVTSAAPSVAVVLSQDWCPQWTAMDAYLNRLAGAGADPGGGTETVVFHLLYNRVDYFSRFLSFKETVWRNAIIPYVRYYRHGRLVGQSNFVSRRQFLSLLHGPRRRRRHTGQL